MKERNRYHLLIITFLLVLFSGAVYAQTLDLTDMIIDNDEGDVRLRFGIEVDDLLPLEQALEEGWIVELQCRAELNRKRPLFWDDKISEQDFISQVDANQLTGEFTVRVPEEAKNLQGRELESLLEQAWNNIDMDLGPWKELKRDRSYAVTLEVGLERVDVPVWLKRSLFFWSWEAAPTEVFVLNFQY